MSKILDGLGGPVNAQPQGQVQFNPVGFFLAVFDRTLSQLLANPNVFDPETCVDGAREVAERALAVLGFRFLPPMGCEIIKPDLEKEPV